MYLSECCGARTNPDIPICSECGEWCDVYDDDEDDPESIEPDPIKRMQHAIDKSINNLEGIYSSIQIICEDFQKQKEGINK